MAESEIRGTSGNDILTGTSAAERIYGNGGNDTIDGAGGNDIIEGGDGADVIAGGAGDDSIKGGTGVDLFKFAAGDGKDTITDLAAGETVEIRGYSAAQSITHVGGNVVVVLSSGDQLTFSNRTVADVQAALVFVDAPPPPPPPGPTEGDDVLTGTSGDDVINGLGGNDQLSGVAGNDMLDGGTGNDTIKGGTGDDTVAGGAGNDLFVFKAGDGQDVIVDLEAGETVKVSGFSSAQSITQVGSDVVVVLSDTDRITFSNTDSATVGAALQFVPKPPVYNGQLGDSRPNDVQISADGTKIYADGNDGYLRVYSSETGELINSWDVGTQLGGMDISPDGSFAIVTERVPVATHPDPFGGNPTYTVRVHKVDLATGSVTNFDYRTTSSTDYAFYDAAVLANGDVLLTQSILPGYSGGGFTVLLNPSAGTFSVAGFDGQDSVLSVAEDGSHVVALPQNRSDAPVVLYESGVGKVAEHWNYEDGVQGFNKGVQAISTAAGLVAQGVFGFNSGINIYNLQLDYQLNLGTIYPEFKFGLAGLAFDPSGQFLFVLSSDADTIYKLSTSDWTIVGQIAIGVDLSNIAADFGNRLLISPDGGYFTLVTDGGLVTLDPAAPQSPTEGPDTLLGTPANDIIDGLGGDDLIKGMGGDDALNGSGGNDMLAGGEGADSLQGGDGDDKLFSRDVSSEWTQVNFTLPQLDHGVDGDTLNGGAGDDKIFAGFGDNVDGGDDDFGDSLYISFQGAGTGVSADFSLGTLVIGGATITGIEKVIWLEGSKYDDYINAQTGSPDGWGPAGVLFGMGGNDTIIAGDNTTRIDGGDGDDTIHANPGSESLVNGDAGNDTIHAFGDVRGGDGNDAITILDGSYGSWAWGDTGSDVIKGGANNDLLFGGAGADTLDGGGGDDYLVSHGGTQAAPHMGVDVEHDVLAGGEGNDHLQFGYGDDADGGDGTDWLSLNLAQASAGITFDMSVLTSGQQLVLGGGILQNFEKVYNLQGSEFGDTITIAGQVSYVYGGGGDDLITVTDESFSIDGGTGNDVITVTGNWGDIEGGDGDDLFILNGVQQVVNGGEGNNTVDYRNAVAGMTVDLSRPDQANGEWLTRISNVNGSAFADSLMGSSWANVIFGGAGNDALAGAAGDDMLQGGEGVDTFNFAAGDGMDTIADLVAGEKVNITGYTSAQSITQVGADVVVVLSASDRLTFLNSDLTTVKAALPFGVLSAPTTPTAGDDTLTGTDAANSINGLGGNDTIYGLGGNDTLDGGAGNDILDGGTGGDTLRGGIGNDTYHVDSTLDKITEGSRAGTDEVIASVSYTLATRVEVEKMTALGSGAINLTGNEFGQTLQGNDGANALSGMAGNDTLFGGNGADTLKGGLGGDVLWGGAGADLFAYAEKGRSIGNDQVMDFERGADKVDLRALAITSANVTSALSGGNMVLSIDADRNGRADYTITLVGVTQVDSSDFLFT